MTNFPIRSTLAIAIAALGIGSVAQAQQYGDSDNIIAISEWNYDDLYNRGGFDADWLMDRDVSTQEEADIGSVENVLINDKNHIEAIIIQIGGIWDIGDTHVAVPWDQVDIIDGNLQVPLRADNYDDYNLFSGENEYISKSALQQVTQVDDEVDAGNNIWKLSDLIDDYATMGEGMGYGVVENVLFNDNGEMQAVIVSGSSADFADGTYTYPFYGYDYGWNPDRDSYNLPYTADDVSGMDNFDVDQYVGDR
jgi:sporulation protein YlmC with PRC-barrel domain